MKASIFKSIALILLFAMSGCASSGNRVIAQTETNGYAVQAQMQQAVSAWQQQHDYDAAMMQLNRLASYSGGGFQQARLTVTALIELERGNRQDFIRTANELAAGISGFSYVNAQTRHVLTVAYAMQDRDPSNLPGRGYDHRRVQAVYQLLGTEAR